ncbi:MAG TPA: FGGY-family carbohydrate kinase, partial [Chloroflexota bacterium]
VSIGGADTLCTRLGAGQLGASELCLYLGTAAWLSVVERRGADGKPMMRGFGATSTTGAALRWTRDLLAPIAAESRDDGYAALTELAEDVPPGAEGLFFLPHLMGERGPRPDPLARGALVGLTLRHGRPHVVRAILEGTAFQIRRLLDGRLPGRQRLGHDLIGGVACGGATRSPLWIQIIADVTGLVLRVPVIVEAASLGAAILGGAAAGVLALDEAQARMVRVGPVYQPRPAIAARYAELYRRHCQLDDLLAPWFREASPELA